MGDVFDAMNRPQAEPAARSTNKPTTLGVEVPSLPMDEVESAARVMPGKPMHNQQPVNLRITGADDSVDLSGAMGAAFRESVPGGCVPNVVAHHDRMSPITEQYRQIRTQIIARSKDKPLKTHLLTSSAPQEGKSITTLNLGVVFAELRRARTLIIEADLRRPSFQRHFDRSFAIGLTHVLRGDIDDEAEAIHSTVYDNLHIMPAGEHDAERSNELLASHAMVRLLDRIKDRYDHILIDSPPVVSVSDACILGAHCDETILVVRMHKTPRDLVQQSKRQLEAAGCTMAGVVMTHAHHDSMPRYLYQYDA